MKVLVTGGAGFIGSHLAKKLLERGNKVVVLDNFDAFYPRELKEFNISPLLKSKNFRFIKGDIRNLSVVKKCVKNADVVFHLAARPGFFPSFENPEIYHSINVDGTFNVLLASRDAKVKNFIFASSSSVYGVAQYLPIDENHPLNPNSPYGITKLIDEKYCLAFDRIFGLKTNMIRYISVYGPSQRPDMAIAEWTHKIFKKRRVGVKGLIQTRDFTFIDDAVEATILVSEADVHGEVFNLASGKKIPIKYVLNKLIELSGFKNVEVKCFKMRAGDRPDVYADISKIKKILGWRPGTVIDEGLKKYVGWYKNAYGLK